LSLDPRPDQSTTPNDPNSRYRHPKDCRGDADDLPGCRVSLEAPTTRRRHYAEGTSDERPHDNTEDAPATYDIRRIAARCHLHQRDANIG
jgi:hypothetical protein